MEVINQLVGQGFSDLLDWSKNSLWIVFPIAVSIFGIMFVWIFVKKFFNRMVGIKNKEKFKEEDEDEEDY